MYVEIEISQTLCIDRLIPLWQIKIHISVSQSMAYVKMSCLTKIFNINILEYANIAINARRLNYS